MMRHGFPGTVLLLAALVCVAGCGGGGKKSQKNCSGADCTAGPMPRELMYRFLDEGNIDDANMILTDKWPIPRFQPVQLPPPAQLTFQEDPYGDKYWRFIFYSFRGATSLLWAFRTTGDARYRDKLMDLVSAYAARGQQSLFAQDKHTTAFRAMNLTNIYKKLEAAGALSDAEKQMMLGVIENTGTFMLDPKHFEPSFNHGINEANALLVMAENFPDLPGAATWGQTARSRLDSLTSTAVGPDGVANEMSPFYHFYIIDALWQTMTWGKDNNIEISSKIEPTVKGMIRYGTFITHPDGSVPLVAACLARQVRSYDPPTFAGVRAADPQFDYIASGGTSGTEPTERLVLFPAAGHAILRSAFGPARTFEEETHVFFDLSPYRTQQSQYDALNIVLYSAGRTLLTDSGLFTYLTGPDRSYFIGTRAHNTVVVDGLDQSVGNAVAATSLSTPTWIYQSGYHQLYADVTHRRGVLLLKKDLVLVTDQLDGTLPHTFEQIWHVEPDVDVAPNGTGLIASDAKSPVLLVAQGLPTSAPTLVKGQTLPTVDGWYSDAYGVKEPSFSAKFTNAGASTRYVTLLASGMYAVDGATVRSTTTANGFETDICAGGEGYHVSISNLAQQGEVVNVGSSPQACP